MFHLTLFGSSEGEITPKGFTAVTMFGGTDLRRPSLATRVLEFTQRGAEPQSKLNRWLGLDRGLLVTVFGAVTIQRPTLLEEYQALRSLIQTGTVTAERLRELLPFLANSERSNDSYTTLTLFGATEVTERDAAKERKALTTGERAGFITSTERLTLENAIGSPQPAVIQILGELAAHA